MGEEEKKKIERVIAELTKWRDLARERERNRLNTQNLEQDMRNANLLVPSWGLFQDYIEEDVMPNPSSPNLSSPEAFREHVLFGYKHPTYRSVDEMTCSECKVNEKNTAFIPCGHVSSCTKCSIKLKECPICKQPIQSILNVYMNKYLKYKKKYLQLKKNYNII